MKIPTRLLVIQRLCDLLTSEPLEVHGVMVNLTDKVLRGRSVIGDDVATPTLAILESPRADFAVYSGEEEIGRKDNLTLLVQGRIDQDMLTPGDEAYWFAAAIEERLSRVLEVKPSNGRPLYPEHYMLGNLITKLEVAPPVSRPPEDKASATAFFFLVLRVGIAVEIGKPYTDA